MEGIEAPSEISTVPDQVVRLRAAAAAGDKALDALLNQWQLEADERHYGNQQGEVNGLKHN